MSKQIQKKETTAIAELEVSQEMFDALPSADASDYRTPNIVIVQPTSKLAATAGEMVDLNTKQVLAGVGKALNFVPLWFFKSWEIFNEDKAGNREYVGKEVFGPRNAMWKWEEETPTGKTRRYLNTNVYMVLEKDLSTPMPQLYMFRFRGKSTNEGKKLLTFWTNAKNYKQIPYSYVFSISPTMVTDQKGKYFVATLANVMDADKYRQIAGEALKIAHGWVTMIQANLAAMTSASLTVEDVEHEADVTPIPAQPQATTHTTAGQQPLSF